MFLNNIKKLSLKLKCIKVCSIYIISFGSGHNRITKYIYTECAFNFFNYIFASGYKS